MNKRRLVDLIILFITLVIGYFAVKNATAIGDWLFFTRYTPSAEVEQIATDAGMSEYGRKLFYRMDPQFVDRRTINEECGTDALGCTVGRNIYILNDRTPSQYNRSIVTAAHEMLHIGYSRLTEDQLVTVNGELDKQIELIEGDLLKKFNTFSGESYHNEAHSYIGTEEPRLIDSLEVHYKQYFDDRNKVLQALQASPEN